MAKPSSQGGHGQSHDEGRQELGQVVQVLLPIPPAGDEGKGPQRGVRGAKEAASEEKWFDCSCVGLFFLFYLFHFHQALGMVHLIKYILPSPWTGHT